MSSVENVVWIEQPAEDENVEVAQDLPGYETIPSPPAFHSPTQRIADEPIPNEALQPSYGAPPDLILTDKLTEEAVVPGDPLCWQPLTSNTISNETTEGQNEAAPRDVTGADKDAFISSVPQSKTDAEVAPNAPNDASHKVDLNGEQESSRPPGSAALPTSVLESGATEAHVDGTNKATDPLEKILENISEAARKAEELKNHEALKQENWEPAKRSPILTTSEEDPPKKSVRWFDTPSDAPTSQSTQSTVQAVPEDVPKKLEESSATHSTEQEPTPAAQNAVEEPATAVDGDINLDLDEYERKLRQNTKEALDLVDRLCDQSRLAADADQNGTKTAGIQGDVGSESQGSHKARVENNSVSELLVAEGDFEISSYRVSSAVMQEPTGCIILPGRKLLILDNQLGLVLINLHTRETLKAPPCEQWRNPECAVYVFSTEQILVIAECVDSDGNAIRHICRFDSQLNLVDKVEAPKQIRDLVVVQCRMCYAEPTKSIYMAVSTPNNGFLYELSPEGKWKEVYNTRGRTFADVHFFAVVGPVTELLLVESNRSYIRLVSIYNSRVAESAMLALCEIAGALCVDEAGNYFVFDHATSKISQHSRRNFEKLQEVALVSRAHCQIAANAGLLAVLSKNFRELRLFRYEEPVEEYTPVLPPHVQVTETIDMI